MTNKKITIENGLYFSVFVLALVLRFSQLGIAPLSEVEAANALQADQIASGKFIVVGDSFFYILGTSLLFAIGRTTEFAARLLPAMIGSCIIFAPWLFKDKLGNKVALLLALGLSVDPGLIALSRQANGAILSITFLFLAIGFINSKNEIPAGILLGLALLSGSGFWYGVLTIGFYSVYKLVRNYIGSKAMPESSQEGEENEKSGSRWRKLFLSFVISTATVSTGFMLYPSGINSFFSGFTAFLAGFLPNTGTRIAHLFPIFLAFELLPIILGILGFFIFVVLRRRLDVHWAVLVAITIMLLFLYPGRGTSHLVWLNISLWGLGLSALNKLHRIENDERIPFYGLGILTLISAIFGWTNIRGLLNLLAPTGNEFQIRILSIIGATVILLLALILVAWGWSIRVGVLSLLFSGIGILFLFNLISIFQVINAGSFQSERVWDSSGFIDQDLFLSTIEDYAKWNLGVASPVEIVISASNDNKLKWALRNFDHVSYVTTLPAEIKSEILIAPAESEVALGEKYTGQDFIYTKEPTLSKMNVYQWARWFVKRESISESSQIVLWVRTDLFPGISEDAISQ